MAYVVFFTHEDWADDYPDNPVPPGHHERARFMVHRRRADLRRMGHCRGFSKSTHGRSRQVGPVPLPFTHRQRRR